MGELLSSRIVAAALAGAGVPADWVDARRAIVTNDEHTRAAPLTRRDQRRAARDGAAADRRGARAGARRLRRRHRRRAHDDARPRRRRTIPGALVGAGIDAARDSDLDRRRRHADRRSARHRGAAPGAARCRSPRRPSWRTSAPRCCTRARSCRPSSATSRCASSTRASRTAAGTLITAAGARDGHAADRRWRAKRDVTVVDITSSRMLMAYGFLRQVFEVFERFRRRWTW